MEDHTFDTISRSFENRRCCLVHSASLMFEQEFGVHIDESKMNEIVGDALDSVANDPTIRYDPNSATMPYCVKATVFDSISNHYFGHPWPCTSHIDFNMDEFKERLIREIEGIN